MELAKGLSISRSDRRGRWKTVSALENRAAGAVPKVRSAVVRKYVDMYIS